MKKNELARLTADIPVEVHKKLKAIAALHNKSIRNVLIELINKHLDVDEITTLLKS